MSTTRNTLAAAALAAGVYPPVLAIDPGSAHSGICLRVGTEALEAATVDAQGDLARHTAMVSHARRTVEIAHALIARNRDALTEIAASYGLADPPRVRIAVETLVPPTPAARAKGSRVAVPPTVLADLPGAATVLGVVSEHWRACTPVPPLGQVTLPDGTTVQGWDGLGETGLAPSVLRSSTPEGWLLPQGGTQQRQHQRSAWATAGAAHCLTASPLREQAQHAASHAAAQRPSAAPEALVPVLRAAIAQTGSWDLWQRLPALASATIGLARGEQSAAKEAAEAVAVWLAETEETDDESEGRA